MKTFTAKKMLVHFSDNHTECFSFENRLSQDKTESSV